MTILEDMREIEADLRTIRRDLHAYPEVGYNVQRTADLVATALESYGLAVTRGVGKSGVVATLKCGSSARGIGLRADMDALPMQEENHFPHASRVPGVMHACGHDGHTAMLLGAARYLSANADFDGSVHFIFQPAEEAGGGAQAMIEDGLFERFPMDAVFGLHNWPGIPSGHFAVKPGPIMASTSLFRVTIHGEGCHGALPHLGRDPVFACAQIVTALQSIITRNKNPIESAVLSITQLRAGEARNVVPDEAWLAGTVRTFEERTLSLIEARLNTVASGIADALSCSARIEFERQYPATVNDWKQTALAADVMREVVGEARVNDTVQPTMAAEDFSVMLRARPGCYAFLGNGDGDHRVLGHGDGPCLLHNSSYDFNDSILHIGASYFVTLVRRFLSRAY